MATWHGKPKKHMMEVYLPENYGYGEWKAVECGWEYGTVSDFFRYYTQIEGQEKKWEYTLPKDEAVALLHALAEWYNNYEGKEELDEMIAEIRKDRR